FGEHQNLNSGALSSTDQKVLIAKESGIQFAEKYPEYQSANHSQRLERRGESENVWQFLLQSRNLKDHFDLQSSVVTYLWIVHVQLMQRVVKKSRKEQFLTQMAIFAKKKINSIWIFLHSHNLS
ncbi:hypothetical protein STEG23_036546, partial [Scotinomys teguina]